jgi:MinD-like ATPase involved in chromosome partitioning or flagellar assembly
MSVLGRAPDVSIPSDREIPRAVNEGVPIMLAKPASETAAAFRTLASFYYDGGEIETPPSQAGPGNSRKRIFGRKS